MNTNNAVLFDLDGTLLDTANDLGEALNYVLGSKNLPLVSKQQYRPVASDGAKGLLELGFGEKLLNYDFDELRQAFLTYYQNNIAVHTTLYPQIEELLMALDDKEIPWGIVTNKPEYLSQCLIPHFSQFQQCKVLVAGDTLPQRKPHPAPLLFACEKMNIDAKRCVYVGDAPRDIEAGNSADMHTIIAQWGYIADQNVCHRWHANTMTFNPLDILLTLT